MSFPRSWLERGLEPCGARCRIEWEDGTHIQYVTICDL